MFYDGSAQDTRKPFFEAWRKYCQKLPLTPLEHQIATIILEHPEYHSFFGQENLNLEKNYSGESGETNPFLHLGLHLAVQEQITTDRPAGINALFQKLLQKHRDHLIVEHLIMEQLAYQIWSATQQENYFFDDAKYLTIIQEALDCR